MSSILSPVIVFTGPVGSGKSTQIALITPNLRRRGIKVTPVYYLKTNHLFAYLLTKSLTHMLVKNSSKTSSIGNLLEQRPLLFKKLFRLWLWLDVFSILIKFLLTVYIPSKLGHIILVEEYVPAMIADYFYLKNALKLPLKSIVPTISIISRLMLLCGSASIILLDADPHELKHRWSNRGRGLLEIPDYLNMQRTLLPYICRNLPIRWLLYINTTNKGVQETHRKIVRYLTANHKSRLEENEGAIKRGLPQKILQEECSV